MTNGHKPKPEYNVYSIYATSFRAAIDGQEMEACRQSLVFFFSSIL